MANFTLWSRENLERLAAELTEENIQLRADLRAALDAYRALVRAQGAITQKEEHLRTAP